MNLWNATGFFTLAAFDRGDVDGPGSVHHFIADLEGESAAHGEPGGGPSAHDDGGLKAPLVAGAAING